MSVIPNNIEYYVCIQVYIILNRYVYVNKPYASNIHGEQFWFKKEV